MFTYNVIPQIFGRIFFKYSVLGYPGLVTYYDTTGLNCISAAIIFRYFLCIVTFMPTTGLGCLVLGIYVLETSKVA